MKHELACERETVYVEARDLLEYVEIDLPRYGSEDGCLSARDVATVIMELGTSAMNLE